MLAPALLCSVCKSSTEADGCFASTCNCSERKRQDSNPGEADKHVQKLKQLSQLITLEHRQQHDFVNDFHDSHPHVYQYDWEHTDAPHLGQEIWNHIKAAGIRTKRVERGVDHGVW